MTKKKSERPDGVADPRKAREQQTVLANPRRDPFKDGIALDRRRLRAHAVTKKVAHRAGSYAASGSDDLPPTLLGYRVIKRTEFVNERMGYGERIAVPLGQNAQMRVSQRTRSGVQKLGASDATTETAKRRKKGG